MAGSDPAGRPPWARLGHRQRPRGPSLFPDRVPARSAPVAGNPCWRPGVGTAKVVSGGSASRGRLQLNRGMNGFDFGG